MNEQATVVDRWSTRAERMRAMQGEVQGPRIHFDGIRKEFVTKATRSLAIEHVDFRIQAGEFICLLGRSGCGKSTLLNMLAGFLKPTQGRVLVNGAEVAGPGLDRGIVAQNGALFPWLTALENVEFGMRMKGMSQRERKEEAHRLLHLFGLKSFEASYPRQLSGGMQQRVAIARAMAIAPTILLMDEPFGALDAQTKLQLEDVLLDLWNAERRTVLFITHDLNEAVTLSDRVVVMSSRPGRILADIAIALPRPRSVRALQKDPRYHEIYAEIWSRLEEGLDGMVECAA